MKTIKFKCRCGEFHHFDICSDRETEPSRPVPLKGGDEWAGSPTPTQESESYWHSVFIKTDNALVKTIENLRLANEEIGRLRARKPATLSEEIYKVKDLQAQIAELKSRIYHARKQLDTKAF